MMEDEDEKLTIKPIYVVDQFARIGLYIGADAVESWSQEQQDLAYEWAISIDLIRNDGLAGTVGPRPDFVTKELSA